MAPMISPPCDLRFFELGLEDAVDEGWVVEGPLGVASGES
jgi:hypothetical protein